MKSKFISTYTHFVSDRPNSFENYFSNRFGANTTKTFPLRFGGNPLFYPSDPAIKEILGEIEEVIAKIRSVSSSLPDIAMKELARSCLVEEILETNQLEGVFSTRKDVYRILDDAKSSKSSKIRSIANKYALLLSGAIPSVKTPKDIRNLYDQLSSGALAKKDEPDGELFRKEGVNITDGVRTIHRGLFPESKIIEALEVFLSIENGSELTPIERAFIAHFIFEYAHPFYDGNGRCGRYLMTLFAMKDLPSVVAFRISTAIGKRKQKYYKAFERTQDIRNRSDLSTFVYPNLEMFLEECGGLYDDIAMKIEMAASLYRAIQNSGIVLNQDPVIQALADATSFATFGIRIQDIVASARVSIATVKRRIKFLEEKGWLMKEKNGYQSYFRLNIDAIG